MGICSSHRNPKLGCKLCAATPEDLFGKEAWERARAAAKEAGETTCKACGFVYYLTTNRCPMCGEPHTASVV